MHPIISRTFSRDAREQSFSVNIVRDANIFQINLYTEQAECVYRHHKTNFFLQQFNLKMKLPRSYSSPLNKLDISEEMARVNEISQTDGQDNRQTRSIRCARNRGVQLSYFRHASKKFAATARLSTRHRYRKRDVSRLS
jgi:hypothetical protein